MIARRLPEDKQLACPFEEDGRCLDEPPGSVTMVIAAEEGEGGTGFFEAVQRVLFGVSDVFEEAPDIGELELTGVALVVEEDEGTGPASMTFRGPVLAESITGELTDEFQKTGGLWGGLHRRGYRGQGWPPKLGVLGLVACLLLSGREGKQIRQ